MVESMRGCHESASIDHDLILIGKLCLAMMRRVEVENLLRKHNEKRDESGRMITHDQDTPQHKCR